MKGKIIITLDSDALDFLAKKGDLSAEEIKESLKEGFVKHLECELLFCKVDIEVTE